MPNDLGRQAITVAELMATLSKMPLDAKVFTSLDGPPPFFSPTDGSRRRRYEWNVTPLLMGFKAEIAPMSSGKTAYNHIFDSDARVTEPVVVLYRRGDQIPE